MRGHRLTGCPQNNTDVEPDLENGKQLRILRRRQDDCPTTVGISPSPRFRFHFSR